MFHLALKAKLPIIGIQTDDLLNVIAILQSIAERKVVPFPATMQTPLKSDSLYFTETLDDITVDNSKRLIDQEAQLVIINPEKTSPLIFDAGTLPTPDSFILTYLESFVDKDDLPKVMLVLRGLSLKSTSEIVQLTMARTGSVHPSEIRRTRMMLGGSVPGLHTLDTDYDFYSMPEALKAWIDLNDKYFLAENVPLKLVPRGVMFEGPPGVGKSMASKVLARHWSVPLFRLDISTSLNRMLGESESRVARSLANVERDSPCVLLVDEVEKLFGDPEGGTTMRIMSQLLWWLQDHKARVLTVMTTNKLSLIPPELYRPGRIDKVIQIKLLTLFEAEVFASRVYSSLMGEKPTDRRRKFMRDALVGSKKSEFSNSEVAELVFDIVKAKNWIDLNKK